MRKIIKVHNNKKIKASELYTVRKRLLMTFIQAGFSYAPYHKFYSDINKNSNFRIITYSIGMSRIPDIYIRYF